MNKDIRVTELGNKELHWIGIYEPIVYCFDIQIPLLTIDIRVVWTFLKLLHTNSTHTSVRERELTIASSVCVHVLIRNTSTSA